MEALAGLHIVTESSSSLVCRESAASQNVLHSSHPSFRPWKSSPASCNASLRANPGKGLECSRADSTLLLLQSRESREKRPQKHRLSCSLKASAPALQREFPLLRRLGEMEFDKQRHRLSAWSRSSSGVDGRRAERMKLAAQRQVVAAAGPDDKVRWWEVRGGPNMTDIHSVTEFVDALASAGERLVVVDFYATWCGSCRSLYPKLCQMAKQYPDVVFLKVNFDENKPMCKSLNIRVLPFFHFYRGADGRLDGFSASISKIQKLRDAIATHNTERCYLGPTVGVGDLELTPAPPAPPTPSPDAQMPAGASTS